MGGLIFLLLIVIVVMFVVPAVALAKASQALRAIEELRERLRMLESRLQTPRQGAPREPLAIISEPPPPAPIIPPVSVPPPLPISGVPAIATVKAAVMTEEIRSQTTAPSSRKIDWEQFMGAKMFAWIGGFALFLGVAFFVKYSFEHNLIPPELRVAIGFLAGIALVGGGMLLKREFSR